MASTLSRRLVGQVLEEETRVERYQPRDGETEATNATGRVDWGDVRVNA